MGEHYEREREGYDPTILVKQNLGEIAEFYLEAKKAVEDNDVDLMQRFLRRATNRLRPLWKALRTMEVDATWIRDLIDGRPVKPYVNLDHPTGGTFLDLLANTESCQVHYVPCGTDGKHNDGKAIEFYLQEGCELCGEYLVRAVERWRDNEHKTVQGV